MAYRLDIDKKLTKELEEFALKECNVTREELVSAEENEDVRQKLIDIFFDIEVEELTDDSITERGYKAADIVTILCYPMSANYDEDEE